MADKRRSFADVPADEPPVVKGESLTEFIIGFPPYQDRLLQAGFVAHARIQGWTHAPHRVWQDRFEAFRNQSA